MTSGHRSYNYKVFETMTNRARSKSRNDWIHAWDKTVITMKKNSNVSINPEIYDEVFHQEESKDEVKFYTKRPISFNVPERYLLNKLGNDECNIMVILEGWLTFEKNEYTNLLKLTSSGKLISSDFGTRVEYYRKNKPFGWKFLNSIHYDYEPSFANHPVFHAQLSNRSLLYSKAGYDFASLYPLSGNVELLKATRIPTFQMDIFSTLVSICADHLIPTVHNPSEKFIEIQQNCDFFVGIDNLQKNVIESNCLRSLRSYPQG